MVLEERVDANDAFYTRKLEKQESDHQGLMALADERLRQLEQHVSSSNMVRRQLEQHERDHQG